MGGHGRSAPLPLTGVGGCRRSLGAGRGQFRSGGRYAHSSPVPTPPQTEGQIVWRCRPPLARRRRPAMPLSFPASAHLWEVSRPPPLWLPSVWRRPWPEQVRGAGLEGGAGLEEGVGMEEGRGLCEAGPICSPPGCPGLCLVLPSVRGRSSAGRASAAGHPLLPSPRVSARATAVAGRGRKSAASTCAGKTRSRSRVRVGCVLVRGGTPCARDVLRRPVGRDVSPGR